MNYVTISTVTPVYNGAKYLRNLVHELNEFRSSLHSSQEQINLIESIFIIDEAIDNSDEVLNELSQEYDWVKVITLSRNFGQHPATVAGILHSSGDWVVTLDEDLQHKPKFIPYLLAKIPESNSDICYAKAKEKVHKSVVKDGFARFFKKLISRILGNPNIEDFNSFRLIRGSIARAASAISRHESYLDIVLGWFSKRIITTSIVLLDERNQNQEEDSGYSFYGLIKHAKRMVMSTKIKVLRIGIPIGIFAFIISIGVSFFALGSTILNMNTIINKGWSSLILVMLFFGGLSSLLIGFVLESISDLSLSVNGKPTFFVVDRSKDALLKKGLQSLKNATIHNS